MLFFVYNVNGIYSKKKKVCVIDIKNGEVGERKGERYLDFWFSDYMIQFVFFVIDLVIILMCFEFMLLFLQFYIRGDI